MIEILAALLRFTMVAFIAYKVVRWGYMLNYVERVGLGIMGGSAFLTIPVILDGGAEGTPFDNWAGVLMSVGILLYLGGRMSRHIQHEARNDAAVSKARDYLVGRGKL